MSIKPIRIAEIRTRLAFLSAATVRELAVSLIITLSQVRRRQILEAAEICYTGLLALELNRLEAKITELRPFAEQFRSSYIPTEEMRRKAARWNAAIKRQNTLSKQLKHLTEMPHVKRACGIEDTTS